MRPQVLRTVEKVSKNGDHILVRVTVDGKYTRTEIYKKIDSF